MAIFLSGIKVGLLIVAKILRVIAGTGLLVSLVGYVILKAAPLTAEVTIHVAEPDVVIEIDDRAERIEGWPSDPIVMDVTGGRHTLVMSRDGEELYRDEFTVRVGDACVLTTWKIEAAPLPATTVADPEGKPNREVMLKID